MTHDLVGLHKPSLADLHPDTTISLGANSSAFLDLMRALAASLVLVDHELGILAGRHDLPTGAIGVGIFFILSGFLIQQSALARFRRPTPQFTVFLVDRFARIFTAYVPILLLIAAINFWVQPGRWGQEGRSTGLVALLGNLLLLQNYPVFQLMLHVVGPGFYIRSYNTAEPFWTIPIEFSIYVVFAIVFFGLIKGERLRGLVAPFLALIATPVVLWNVAAGGGNGLTLVWIVGAVAAFVWTTAWSRSHSKLQLGLIITPICFGCLLARGAKINWNFHDLGIVFCEATTLLGMISILESISTVAKWLRMFCNAAASYSYTLYLTHNTTVILVSLLVRHFQLGTQLCLAFLSAHIVAAMLYFAFERHYRQVGHSIKRWLIPATPVVKHM